MNLSISKTRISSFLLTLIISISWMIYPFTMVYFLGRPQIQIGFAVLFLIISISLFLLQPLILRRVTLLQKVIVSFWILYLFLLYIASVYSINFSALNFFINFFVKFLFFLFLLMYINVELISRLFNIYSHLMLICTIMALFVAIGVAIGLLNPIFTLHTTIADGSSYTHQYYLGAVYGFVRINTPFVLYRLQSFMGEPGTFAMALAPALYWFLFVEKKRWKIFIICFGLFGTLSIGIYLCFILLLVLFSFQKKKYFQILVLVCSISLVFLPFAFLLSSSVDSTSWVSNYLLSKFIGPVSSFGARTEEIRRTIVYLQDFVFGSGAGVGMSMVKYPISNGFLKAFLESGVVGGSVYSMLFIFMGIQAVKSVQSTIKISSVNNPLIIVVGLSVLTMLFMGLQRDQPDISFWHMWLYASLFVINMDKTDSLISSR